MIVIQNTTATVAFVSTLGGVPYDLSGANEIEISLKQDVPEKVLIKTLGAGVTTSGDSNEIATGIFTPAETLQLVPGFARAQIRVKNADGTVIGDVAEIVPVAAANSTEVL